MPEDKVNNLTTKLEVMESKVETLVCQNTKEHDAIFKKLDEIQKTLSEQAHGAEIRRSEYMESFATKRELSGLEGDVKIFTQFYWKIIGILGAISFVTSIFGDKIFNAIK